MTTAKRIRLKAFLCVGSVALFETCSLVKAAEPIVYIGASTQDFITRFDTVTGKSTKLAIAGLNATSFVVSADGNTAYVASFSYFPTPVADINIVNITTGKIQGGIDAGVLTTPTGLALNSDGSKLYFVGAGQLQVFDTSTQTIVAQTPVGGAGQGSVALVAGGSEIYVSSATYLQAFDARTLQPITINGLPKSYYFEALAASPDGKTLYVATPDNQTIVTAIDTTTNTVIVNFPYSNEGGVLGLAVSPDGQTLYLSNQKGLFRLSTATGALLGQLVATPLSGQIVPSPDGKYVYVNRSYQGYDVVHPNNYGSNFPGLLQIDVASGAANSLPLSGVAIAEQFTGLGSSIFVLQTLPYISTEDSAALTVTQNLGRAGGTEFLTASANGAVVAGLSNPLYVLTPGEAVVTLVDTAARKIIGQFTYAPPDGDFLTPYSLALNADGSVGYIGIFEKSGNSGQAEVAVLSLPEGNVNSVFTVGSAAGNGGFLTVSPDGTKLYSFLSTFCATDLQTYVTIGCSDLEFRSKFGLLYAQASTFALNDDGTRAYIVAYLTNPKIYGGAEYLIAVDTSSFAVVATLALQGLTQAFGPFIAPAGSAYGIAYSSVTNSVYVQGSGDVENTGILLRVDLGTFAIAARQQVNYFPNGMAITPDGTQLLVTGSTYGTQIFDGITLAYTGYIPGGLQNGIVIPKQ